MVSLTLGNKFDERSTGRCSSAPGARPGGESSDLGFYSFDSLRVSVEGGGLGLQGGGGDGAGGNGDHGVILVLPALGERFLARLQTRGDACGT